MSVVSAISVSQPAAAVRILASVRLYSSIFQFTVLERVDCRWNAASGPPLATAGLWPRLCVASPSLLLPLQLAPRVTRGGLQQLALTRWHHAGGWVPSLHT
eukprot:COSAG01_NODE_976_length_12364_cov_109.353200_12_plen_101_part_00